MTDLQPRGTLTLRTMAMPADTNAAGDIFGGWVVSQMDIAGAIAAAERAGGRVATVAIEAMSFISPVKVGDVFSVYVWIERVGNTSISIGMEAWSSQRSALVSSKVTEGHFIFVALDENGVKRQIAP